VSISQKGQKNEKKLWPLPYDLSNHPHQEVITFNLPQMRRSQHLYRYGQLLLYLK